VKRISAAVAVAMLAAVVAGCGASSPEITTQDVEKSVVNFGKKKERKLGDLIVTNGYILDGAQQLVGRFDMTETLTGFANEREVRTKQVQMSWADSADSLVLIGTHEHPPNAAPIDDVAEFVVVGGTGRYDGVRGKAEVQFDGQYYRWKLRLL
jgi:hypothetical protein